MVQKEGSQGPEKRIRGFGKKVWSLRTLGKIKHFIWKCVHSILPIRENLFRRKITSELNCPVCRMDCETLPHFFFLNASGHIQRGEFP